MKKFLIITLSVIVLFFIFSVTKTISDNSSKNYLKYNTTNEVQSEYSDLKNSSSADYYYYLLENNMHYPQQDKVILTSKDILDDQSQDFEHLVEYNGKTDVVLSKETGQITYSVNVVEAGYYNLSLDYFPYEGKGTNIERTILINGNVPFSGAQNLVLHRKWGSEGEIVQDIFGNDIKPSQIEKPEWMNASFKDSVGYISGNYAFYFEEGLNTITLRSEIEPLVIDKLVVTSIKELTKYDDIKELYANNNYKDVKEQIKIIEGENSVATTSPTLYPLNDRGVSTTPNSPNKIKLNTVGGNNWRISGDKIFWDFTVEETGLYSLSFRLKQSLAKGITSSRNIYINGEIPFKELQDYEFTQSNSWRIQTLGTEKEAFKFYFEEGQTYEISMEVSLGEYGFKIAQIENSINELSKIYRNILRITTAEPDPNKDYQLTERIPNLLDVFAKELENLEMVRDDLIKLSGTKSEKTGILDTMIIQLKDFIKKPSKIHKKIASFNSNIASLGTLVISLSEHPLEIDYFVIHSEDVKLPKNNLGVFKSMYFSTVSFFSTFFIDYSSIGKTVEGKNETINVWLTVGKDQTNILRKLIDEKFTPNSGIQVDLKLVNSASLLPATLSGKGPDVAMGVDSNTPVNYALRNASYDLRNFEDFDSITGRFMESAFVPYEFNDGVYALPEQQVFLMMFYRKDILEEMNLEAPDTWDELIELIPDLQTNNLEFYLPVPRTAGGVVNLPANPIFSTMFYQNDGEFYINNNSESGFNEALGPEIFEKWTQFYNDYSFSLEANFPNRFRSGQMPLGITYYNMYNTLSVFAPEIRGKWGFMPVPGTKYIDENGVEQIRRETVSSNTGTMLLNNSTKKDASWEFMKWWTSDETQIRFGREMEGILGAAARYPTANINAMEALPWRPDELAILKEQWASVKGIPEVPGSYMTGRHLDNAFRKVINDKVNARETIYDYVQIINDEIKSKREEFGLA